MGLFGRKGGAAVSPSPKPGGGTDNLEAAPSSESGSVGLDGGLARIVFRNEMYRDRYRTLSTGMKVGAGALLGSIVLNAALAWALVHRGPVYFATSDDGRILPLTPLSQPVLSDRRIVLFATRVAVGAYSYDFMNWRKTLPALSRSFTKPGFDSFVLSLKSSGNLTQVVNNRMVVDAVPTGAGVVVAKGQVRGVYEWKVQVPLLVSFQTATGTVSQHLLVTLLLVRRSEIRHPEGLAVQQFLAVEKNV